MISTRHRWGDKARLPHKTEQQCTRCGMVKTTRHEHEGLRDLYWTEYWRDLELVGREKTPPCDARLEMAEA
jgi:hypothetical protein